MKKKVFLYLGIFITVLGIGSITEEIHGCFMCPIDGFLFWMGLTSGKAFGFLEVICWDLILLGVFMIIISLTFFPVKRESTVKKIAIKFPKMHTWRRRRMFVHIFMYSVIVLHITLTLLGKTDLKSICPRSLGEMAMKGQFGTAAVFWSFMLLLVLVWGRGLCGWLCVYAPVQEQAVNILGACGCDSNNKKFKKIPIVLITTVVLWSSFLFYIIKNLHHLDFNISHGYKVDSYWIFLGGALTMLPLTIFATYLLGSRWFCKYLCPIGGLLSVYSIFSFIKVRVDKSKCINCKVCSKKCQMSVDIYKYVSENSKNISDRRCLTCGDCIDACPKKALYFGFKDKEWSFIEKDDKSQNMFNEVINNHSSNVSLKQNFEELSIK